MILDHPTRFHDLGLEHERAENAMQTALNNNRVKASETWRYFCGIAWAILRERQEMARDMLDSGAVE